jgi:hypothetical protein
MASKEETRLVRLYPYDPKRGYVMKTYVDIGLGLKFVESRGWYKVDAGAVSVLKKVVQDTMSPHKLPAFMIAKNIAEAESMMGEFSAPAEEEKKIGTADAPVQLHRPGKKSPQPRRRTRSSED